MDGPICRSGYGQAWRGLAGLLILIFANNASALGIGSARVDSFLAEPLDIRAPLVSTRKQEFSIRPTARLLHEEAYPTYGLAAPRHALADLELELVGSHSDEWWLRIRSRSPLSEPIVNLLMELQSAAEKRVQIVSVLLDPRPGTEVFHQPSFRTTTDHINTRPRLAPSAGSDPTAAAPDAAQPARSTLTLPESSGLRLLEPGHQAALSAVEHARYDRPGSISGSTQNPTEGMSLSLDVADSMAQSLGRIDTSAPAQVRFGLSELTLVVVALSGLVALRLKSSPIFQSMRERVLPTDRRPGSTGPAPVPPPASLPHFAQAAGSDLRPNAGESLRLASAAPNVPQLIAVDSAPAGPRTEPLAQSANDLIRSASGSAAERLPAATAGDANHADADAPALLDGHTPEHGSIAPVVEPAASFAQADAAHPPPASPDQGERAGLYGATDCYVAQLSALTQAPGPAGTAPAEARATERPAPGMTSGDSLDMPLDDETPDLYRALLKIAEEQSGQPAKHEVARIYHSLAEYRQTLQTLEHDLVQGQDTDTVNDRGPLLGEEEAQPVSESLRGQLAQLAVELSNAGNPRDAQWLLRRIRLEAEGPESEALAKVIPLNRTRNES